MTRLNKTIAALGAPKYLQISPILMDKLGQTPSIPSGWGRLRVPPASRQRGRSARSLQAEGLIIRIRRQGIDGPLSWTMSSTIARGAQCAIDGRTEQHCALGPFIGRPRRHTKLLQSFVYTH